MPFLLDTNVLSELSRTRPNAGVTRFVRETTGQELCLSVVTFAEIRRGIARLRIKNDHGQANRYDQWFGDTRDWFVGDVLPVDRHIAEAWGEMDARRPQPIADGLIAATAKVYDLTVVTRNVRDFSDAGVRVLNPFRD
jgi:predicted nucleic acid-binding protein